MTTMNIKNPTKQQKADAKKMAVEEHHEIPIVVGAENCKYEKLINDIVMKKDLFWIAVAEAWWKNQYGGKYNTKGDSNDGIAFG